MVYVLEDDGSIRELICYSLEKSGISARGFAAPSDFRHALRHDGKPELVLLDVMLPGEDGMSVLRFLRGSEETKRIPVIMLTAKSSEFDKVSALNAGADDYITKPFGVMELIARVGAVLRRSGADKTAAAAEAQTYTVGALTLSLSDRTVTVNGAPVTLTLKEFELLHLLFANRGAVLSRDLILERIWGFSFDGETRTVDVHIRTLRQKLGACGDVIETVRGIGYIIRKEASGRK